MTVEIRKLVVKGARSLTSADNVFQDGDYDFAVSRTYYVLRVLSWIGRKGSPSTPTCW